MNEISINSLGGESTKNKSTTGGNKKKIVGIKYRSGKNITE